MLGIAARALGRRLAFALFHPPRRRHHRAPIDVGLTAEALRVETADGLGLHVWAITGMREGVVVIGHGIGMSKSASLRHARLASDLGYNVIMFDHRNHGLSDHDPSSGDLARRFSLDIEATLAEAGRLWPAAGHRIVWGFSFSTFPTLYSLRRARAGIDAVILDSGPGDDLTTLLTGFLLGGGMPLPSVLSRVARTPRIAAAFAQSAIDMLGCEWPPVLETHAAKLFLIGDQDSIVPAGQTERLAARYPSSTIVHLAVTHLAGITAARSEYESAVVSFMRAIDRRELDDARPV